MKKKNILENGDFSSHSLEFKRLLKSELLTRLMLRTNSIKTDRRNVLKIGNKVVLKKNK